MRGVPKAERDRRVDEVAKILGLDHLLDRRPAALSGGQRQRVAMGRAIVREPQAFLMDEPLSNLDAKLRVSMRAQLSLLHRRLGTTTVYVTHDQVEAMTLGQRVAVMRDGTLQQYDTPQRLFRHPANLFVAAFIGSPSMNFAEVTVTSGRFALAGAEFSAPAGCPDGTVILGIRPTAFAAGGRDGWPVITVEPRVVEDLGDERLIIFELDAPQVDTDAVRAAYDARESGDVALLGEAKAQFTARLPADVPVTLGEPLALAVDPTRLYFFDPATGAAVTAEREVSAAVS
jgi:multiple sugar transport system ATP-binding protein